MKQLLVQKQPIGEHIYKSVHMIRIKHQGLTSVGSSGRGGGQQVLILFAHAAFSRAKKPIGENICKSVYRIRIKHQGLTSVGSSGRGRGQQVLILFAHEASSKAELTNR